MYSSLLQISDSDLTSEAEVEVRFLEKLFSDLGYKSSSVLPKKHIPSLFIHDGRQKTNKEVDFMLKNKNGDPWIIVEAKEPKENITNSWGQAASYALSYNKDKSESKKIKWLLISNGYFTSLFPHDSITPVVTLQLGDFESGLPPYVALRNYIKYDSSINVPKQNNTFCGLPPAVLNKKFLEAHNMIRKSEKLAPHDAFFEFCKFVFIKIREDKKRRNYDENISSDQIPLTTNWLNLLSQTDNHPVRNILFKNLKEELENQIRENKKRRIFDESETLALSSTTCKKLIEMFESIDLSSIDEDLNGRMFEVFLNASIRGKELGQFFTPRSVVDFMTRISLRNVDLQNPPRIIDACCGTAGFLIETMAYLTGRLRNDNRFTNVQREIIHNKICNECLFGIEANPRTSRIARINMYLHGDGGSHIYRGDGLDTHPKPTSDMKNEEIIEIEDRVEKIKNGSFNIVLSNPPFSMTYKSNKDDEKNIINQFSFTEGQSSVKSSVLFVTRYYELLDKGSEILIILDDTLLNGISQIQFREWLLSNFIILGVHSLPFNAFLKAKANIKTSILHLKKKTDATEQQCDVFMSIANNIGHDNSLKDTPERNNLNIILSAYLEWQRTGSLSPNTKDNPDKTENLEGPMQYWITKSSDIKSERIDSFFYCPVLSDVYLKLKELEQKRRIKIVKGSEIDLVDKLTANQKRNMETDGLFYKYIEIGDVTTFGLITRYDYNEFSELPTRAEYMVKKGDILLALNNSSRGTVVFVPDDYDGLLCTSGFLVIRPKNKEEGLLLWYSLRSEFCRKQIYYLSQTASQPELKIESWNKYFQIPIPIGKEREIAIQKAKDFFDHLSMLSEVNNCRFS